MNRSHRNNHRCIYTILVFIISLMMVFSQLAPVFATGEPGGSDQGTPAALQNDDQGSGDGEATGGSEDNSEEASENDDENESADAIGGATAEEAESPDNAILLSSPQSAPKAAGPFSASEIRETYGDPVDFKEYITKATVQRMGSTQTSWSDVTDDNPVKSGDDVKFILDYTLPAGTLGNADDPDSATNTIKYKITPPIGDIMAESGEVKDNTGKVIGRYTIEPKSEGSSQTGEITIIFDDSYVVANMRTRLPSTISFTSAINGWTGKDDGVVDVPIGGSAGTVEIIVQPEDASGELKIVKRTANNVNRGTGELIRHSMTVSSASGTKGDVTITDTMVLEVIKGDGNFKVTKTSAPDPDTGARTTTDVDPKSLVNQSGQTTFNDSDGNHDSGFTMVLPPLGAGEYYTVTYDAYYPKMVNGSVTVRNTAIARSTDDDDKLLISSSTVNNTLSNTPLAKTGALVAETDPTTGEVKYYIDWTVRINTNHADIGGWSLRDNGLYNDENTHLDATDIKLTKDPGSQGETVIDIADTTLDGTSSLYTFPTGDSSSYVLKYRTAMNFDDTNYQAKNTIAMDPPQGDQDNAGNGSSSGVPGISGIGTEKENDGVEVDLSDPSNPVAKINWTMTIDAKAAPVPAESVFEDVLGNNQKFAENQDQLKQIVEAAFKAKNIDIEWIDQDAGKEETQFKFKLTKAMPAGTTISFSYTSIVTGFNPKSQSTYENKASILNPNNETIGNPSDRVTYKPAINKYDASSGKTTGTNRITYHKVGDSAVTYNGNKQTIKWGFDVNIPSTYYGDNSKIDEYVIIRDELPEGLTPAYMAFGTITFANIKDATENDPSKIELNLPDWIATQSDVDNGYAKNVGDKISDAGTYSFEAWCEKEAGIEHDVYTVFLKMPKDTINYYKAKTYEFKLFAEIAEDWNWGINERKIKESQFENNIYLIPDSQDVSASVIDSKHTQDILFDENERAVVKGNDYDKNDDVRNIPYYVVVNEEERDLVKGSETLTFKDTMVAEYPWGVSVTLEPDSFKVYEVDKDSIKYKKNASGQNVVDESKIIRRKDITDQVSFNHIAGKESGDEWIVSAELPDEKALLVEYVYHMSGWTTGRERVRLHNTSELTGVATDSNNGEVSDAIQLQKSDAVSNIMRMTLEKVDSESNVIEIAGAQFELYVYTGTKYLHIATLTTDEKGRLEVDDSTFVDIDDPEAIQEGQEGVEFNYNTAYKLVEVRPPKGYRLDSTPTEFVIMDKDNPIDTSDLSTVKYIPDDFEGYYLGLGSAFVYFPNVQMHPDLEIKKVASVKTAMVGDEIEYKVTVKNNSEDDAYDCVVEDELGRGLEYVSDDMKGVNEGSKITWEGVDIKAGETITINVTAKVLEAAPDSLINKAYVTYPDVDGPVTKEGEALVGLEKPAGDEKGSKKGIDTGDHDMIYTYSVLIAMALAALSYALIKRNRDRC